MILTEVKDPQVTEHFNVETDNMRCPCCGEIKISMTFIRKIQILRYHLAIPFYLDKEGGGFYRCEKYNKSISGASESQHMSGRAIDISVIGWSGVTKWKCLRLAMLLDLSIGKYQTYFHLDSRPVSPVLFP